MYTNLKTLSQIEAEKSVTKIFLERKKNEQIKGLISSMWLILQYIVQHVITKLCTKFQDSRSSSSWEIFDEKKVYSQTDGHTNILTKRQKLYNPYMYTGGLMKNKFTEEV